MEKYVRGWGPQLSALWYYLTLLLANHSQTGVFVTLLPEVKRCFLITCGRLSEGADLLKTGSTFWHIWRPFWGLQRPLVSKQKASPVASGIFMDSMHMGPLIWWVLIIHGGPGNRYQDLTLQVSQHSWSPCGSGLAVFLNKVLKAFHTWGAHHIFYAFLQAEKILFSKWLKFKWMNNFTWIFCL